MVVRYQTFVDDHITSRGQTLWCECHLSTQRVVQRMHAATHLSLRFKIQRVGRTYLGPVSTTGALLVSQTLRFFRRVWVYLAQLVVEVVCIGVKRVLRFSVRVLGCIWDLLFLSERLSRDGLGAALAEMGRAVAASCTSVAPMDGSAFEVEM